MLRAWKDPIVFCSAFVRTLDPHDRVTPVKRFPNLLSKAQQFEFGYIKRLIELWQSEPLLLVAKSRQMMVTWTFIAIHLWLAMTKKGSYIFFQSKQEHDADDLVKRAKFIYNHLPPLMQSWAPAAKQPNGEVGSFCQLEFPSQFSTIRGVSQNPEAIRMHTATAIFSDEMAFQEQAREAFVAAKPTVDGGGRFAGISTANGRNFFQRVWSDQE